MCEQMRMPLEGLHTETGPGVLEAAIAVDATLASADKAALFKTMLKVFAQRRNLMATFMAKWSKDWPGQSGHIHVSLRNKAGKSAFFDPKAPHRMSKTMRHFVAGQQKLMPELLAMVAPTVNSYSRLIPGFWAPTSATWGVENRTCALRVIPGSDKSQRVEYRIAAADGNPYLALAVALASGLWGIEHAAELEEPIAGNAYELKPKKAAMLPPTLWDAAQRLKASKPARELFGDAFVDHFAATREWEEREFRKHITDWELARYFEII
jgi:glutamine synthetase